MKTIITILLGLLVSFTTFAQRYLNPIFTNVNVYSNITYGAAINIQSQVQNLILDFYEPNGDSALNRPLLIYAHGGGFSDTNQTRKLPHIIAFCDSFARRGYVVASIDYRLDSIPTGLSNRGIINAMHDAKAAVRYFKRFATTYKIDTNLIFFGGESAGAITALNATYINKAAEVLFPLTLPINTNLSIEGNSGNAGYTSTTKAALCFCGGTNFVSGLPLFDTNAINLSSDPPVLFVHGTADPLIPVQYALNVAIRTTHLGIPNLFYTFNGATHCPWILGLPNAPAYLDSLIHFTAPFLYAVVSSATYLDKKITEPIVFKIFPNPGEQQITISLQPFIQNDKAFITNAFGQKVKELLIDKENTSFDVSAFPKGIYFIQLQKSQGLPLKFIVK